MREVLRRRRASRRGHVIAGVIATAVALVGLAAAVRTPSAAWTSRQAAPPSVSTFLGRTVDTFAPAGTPTALVVVLHGYYGTPDEVAVDSGLVAPALRSGWLLVAPQGLGTSWNAGMCCGTASKQGLDDSDLLAELIIATRARYHLPAKAPTAVVGVSNGGMMAAELMCKRPGVVDGALLMSANLQDPGCTQLRAKEVLAVRGTEDKVLPIAGLALSPVVHTRLLPDSVLLHAVTAGQTCVPGPAPAPTSFATETVTRCPGESLTYITEKGPHAWLQGSQEPAVATLPQLTAMVNRLRGSA